VDPDVKYPEYGQQLINFKPLLNDKIQPPDENNFLSHLANILEIDRFLSKFRDENQLVDFRTPIKNVNVTKKLIVHKIVTHNEDWSMERRMIEYFDNETRLSEGSLCARGFIDIDIDKLVKAKGLYPDMPIGYFYNNLTLSQITNIFKNEEMIGLKAKTIADRPFVIFKYDSIKSQMSEKEFNQGVIGGISAKNFLAAVKSIEEKWINYRQTVIKKG